MPSFFCKRPFNTKYRKKNSSILENPSLVAQVVVAMVIATNYVIGGLS